MKKRIAKKIAKRYLAGKLPVRIIKDRWNIDTDGTYVDVAIAVLPVKVWRIVREMCYARGWSGCWWDDPTYLRIWETRNGNTEVYNSVWFTDEQLWKML